MPETSEVWTPRERLLITEQLIELPTVVGHHVLLAGTLRSLGLPLDNERAEPNTALDDNPGDKS